MGTQRRHTRTMSKTGTTFEAGGDIAQVKIKQYHEIQSKIQEQLDKAEIQTVEAEMSFLNLYDFASIKLKQKIEDLNPTLVLQAVGRHFKAFATMSRLDGSSSTVKVTISKNDNRISNLNEWIQNRLVAGKINYNELDTLKKLLLDISKMEGYNKQAMLCIYIVAELQKGRAVGQCLTENIYKIINPKGSESLN